MKKELKTIVSAILTLIFMIPIFWIGCGVVYMLSKMIGISYEATNTYLFIYLQPSVLLITSFITMLFVMYKTFKSFNIKRLGLLILYKLSFACQIVYVLYLYKTFKGMSAHDIGMKTYGLLRQWGDTLQMGYIGVNVFVFIFLFLGIMAFNFVPFRILNEKSKELNLNKKLYYLVRPFMFILLFAGICIYYEKEVRQGKYFNSKEELNEFIKDTAGFFYHGLLEGDKRQMEENN